MAVLMKGLYCEKIYKSTIFLDMYCSVLYISYMNRLNRMKQSQVIAALVEGNSLRSTVRMTGVALNTIQKLLADLGAACMEYQDKAMRNLSCKHIQCDEIWQF